MQNHLFPPSYTHDQFLPQKPFAETSSVILQLFNASTTRLHPNQNRPKPMHSHNSFHRLQLRRSPLLYNLIQAAVALHMKSQSPPTSSTCHLLPLLLARPSRKHHSNTSTAAPLLPHPAEAAPLLTKTPAAKLHLCSSALHSHTVLSPLPNKTTCASSLLSDNRKQPTHVHSSLLLHGRRKQQLLHEITPNCTPNSTPLSSQTNLSFQLLPFTKILAAALQTETHQAAASTSSSPPCNIPLQPNSRPTASFHPSSSP